MSSIQRRWSEHEFIRRKQQDDYVEMTRKYQELSYATTATVTADSFGLLNSMRQQSSTPVKKPIYLGTLRERLDAEIKAWCGGILEAA